MGEEKDDGLGLSLRLGFDAPPPPPPPLQPPQQVVQLVSQPPPPFQHESLSSTSGFLKFNFMSHSNHRSSWTDIFQSPGTLLR